MAATKSITSLPSMPVFSRTAFALALLLMTLAAHSQVALSQNCSVELSGLVNCAPYVVPGAPNGAPSPQCCSALGAIDHSCACSTLEIISRLPSRCNIPSVNCS
ncbi:protein M7-like isoform X2 [Typha angustifolia]|uniref:protein M7-like isoform X2 n=1 Tax=Typha angustifolia TaxID=59011 RepID=UPI003C2B2162